MVYTSNTATACNMEDYAEMAASSMEKAKTKSMMHVMKPFTNQVGGNAQIMELDRNTLCKPLIPRELNFYLDVPHEMRKFLPQYKGVIQALHLETSPTDAYDNELELDDYMRRSKTPQPLPDLEAHIKVCSEEKFLRKDMRLSHRIADQSHNRYFICLENVTSNFHKPCILDIKMGTRQYGDDASPDKRNRQMAKCTASTSARLGVRLCGMQLYQANKDNYICKDKYYGRRLDENGMRRALHNFFHNGFCLRVSIIEKVIERLTELRKAIVKLHSFRFYTSSLLVLYEGCVGDGQLENEDFYDVLKDENTCFDSGLDKYDLGPSAVDEESSSFESSNDSTSASASLSWLSSRKPFLKNRGCSVQHGPIVDVRMIDFAHTTYEGYDGDTTVHSGPDNGYVFGLDNLIRLLKEVEALGEDK